MKPRRIVDICVVILFSCCIDVIATDDEGRHNFTLIESDQGPHIPFSMSPSAVPTIRLTKSPTKAPTSPPTIAPTTNSPTNQPTIDNCKVSESGTFGDLSGDKAVLSYKFELESKQSATTSIGDLLSPVEGGISNSVVKTVPGVCQNSNDNRHRKLLDSGKLIGLSSSPADVPTDETCSVPPGEGNQCTVIDGRISLFLTENVVLTKDEARTIADAVSSYMASDALVNLPDSIVRLGYIESEEIFIDYAIDSPARGVSGGNNSGSGGGFNAGTFATYAGTSAGVIGLLMLAGQYYRKKKDIVGGERDDDDDISIETIEDNEISHVSDDLVEDSRKRYQELRQMPPASVEDMAV